MTDLLANQENCADFKVEVIRSRRRRKSVGARLEDNLMLVFAPYNISQSNLDDIINNFRNKFNRSLLRKKLNQEKSLEAIAKELNHKYFFGRLKDYSIEYVTDQNCKFGCCNFKTRAIRISHAIASMPLWVRDYVIVHELAHLIEPNHAQAFWDLIKEYKLTERAKGYLMAKGMEAEKC